MSVTPFNFPDLSDTPKHEQNVLTTIPHYTGFISMLCYTWIITDILKERRKLQRVYHRLVLCMSLSGANASLWLALSTWPAPRQPGLLGSLGTQKTCTTQGFFIQMNLATPIYNMHLSIYYLLLIKYNWTESRIKRAAEPWMHAVGVILPTATAIAGLPLTLYNPALWCWIVPFPVNCKQSFDNGGYTNCIRGDNASVYMFAFFYTELWLSIAIGTGSLLLVYWAVLGQEQRMERYTFKIRPTNRFTNATSRSPDTPQNEIVDVSRENPSNNRRDSQRTRKRKKQSTNIANLSCLYVAAFVLTWFFPTVAVLMFTTSGNDSYVCTVLTSIFLPLQGFFNFLIYVRPRYQKYRQENPGKYFWVSVGRVLRRTLDCCQLFDDDDHHLGTGTELEEQEANGSAVAART